MVTTHAVVLFYPSYCLPLNFFQCLDVVVSEWIPDRAGILKHRSHDYFVCRVFKSFICSFDVSSEEAQGLVGFIADIVDVGIPTEVCGDLDSRVFCLRFCTRGVAVELVL